MGDDTLCARLGAGGLVPRTHPVCAPFALDAIVVVDPCNPSCNVASSCYRVAQIQALFGESARGAVSVATASLAQKPAAGQQFDFGPIMRALFGGGAAVAGEAHRQSAP